MSLIREHRGTLDDSLQTVQEIGGLNELLDAIRKSFAPFGFPVEPEQLEFVHQGMDSRTGWDTHLILVKGYGVWGMSNGPIG
jgi:hypothetical protein